MEEKPWADPQRLRKVAKELRDRASHASLPGYAEQLIRAAVELEKRAAKLEASI